MTCRDPYIDDMRRFAKLIFWYVARDYIAIGLRKLASVIETPERG